MVARFDLECMHLGFQWVLSWAPKTYRMRGGVSHAQLPDSMSSSDGSLRIGFVTMNGATPQVISGVPYHARAALARRGVTLIDLNASLLPTSDALPARVYRRVKKAVAGSALARGSRAVVARAYAMATPGADATSFDYRATIRLARRVSERLDRMLAQVEIDAIVGTCISTMLYALRTETPIIYSSDATARLITTTYPVYAALPAGRRRAMADIESTSMTKVALFLGASRMTVESAINDHGLDPDRTQVVPWGANITPEPDEEIVATPPTRDALELVVSAADPIRKRLDLCIDVVEELRRRGWNATLNYIGPRHERALSSPAVSTSGWLRLGNVDDKRTHQRVLAKSHFALLPSVGEMYGIAPCESAHYGRPALVSDVGGLPTVVEHGVTGVVLPADATAQAYANEIERIASDPAVYTRMSAAALERGRTVLNWDVWAAHTERAVRRAVPLCARCR